MMTFIKYHWFGFLVSLFALTYLFVFVLVLLAPRQDIEKRGFIPCTEVMADELLECHQGAICMLKAITKNGWCDAKVIGDGIKNWVSGKQKTPWANYLFTPKLEETEEIDEGLQEFYSQNPDINSSMKKLRNLNQKLEAEIQNKEIKEIEDEQK